MKKWYGKWIAVALCAVLLAVLPAAVLQNKGAGEAPVLTAQADAVSSTPVLWNVPREEYREIKKVFDAGSHGDFHTEIIVTVGVITERGFTMGAGEYRKFKKVVSFSSAFNAPVKTKYDPYVSSTDFYDETETGNQMNMMLSATVTAQVPPQWKADAVAAGYRYAYTEGLTDYYVKSVSADYNFDSNYGLN